MYRTNVALVLLATVFTAACSSMSPTAPTNAHLVLTISQDDLPLNGTAVVTATVHESSGTPVDGVLVRFSSSLGSFAPVETYTRSGIATTTFTATANGVGTITALSGSVSSEQVQVRIGDFPQLPEINNTPQAPTVHVSCGNARAGVSLICMVSSSNTTDVVMQWGDGSPEQSIGLASSVAHVFARADHFTVSVRGVDRFGRVATASTIAVVASAPPPPPVFTPQPTVTWVTMTQEEKSSGGCAAFTVSATVATGTTLTNIVVTGVGMSTQTFYSSSGRFAICGLQVNDILTATVTDSSGNTAKYELIVK